MEVEECDQDNPKIIGEIKNYNSRTGFVLVEFIGEVHKVIYTIGDRRD